MMKIAKAMHTEQKNSREFCQSENLIFEDVEKRKMAEGNK